MRTRSTAAAAALAMSACTGTDEVPCLAEPGILCPIGGTGLAGPPVDEGPIEEVSFDLPLDLSVAPDGALHVLDWNNHCVRRLDPATGQIARVAGSGNFPSATDCVDCDARELDLNHPSSVTFAGDRMYIAGWHNSRIFAVDPATMRVVEAIGSGRRGYEGNGGPAAAATFDLPAQVVADPSGGLLVMDGGNQVIRRIDRDGTIGLFAGQCLIELQGAECGDSDPVACPGSDKLTCGDPASTCFSSCRGGFADGPAQAMRMAQPFGAQAQPAGTMLLDGDGGIVFVDTGNHRVRRIDRSGVVTTIAGSGPPGLYAGGGYSGDGGPAIDAELATPRDIARGPDGTLYVADTYNHCVRAISPAGIISTVAGVCQREGYAGDTAPATEALLDLPFGIEVHAGILYIADTGNHAIRAVRL